MQEKFKPEEIEVIIAGMRENLDYTIYADKKYSAPKMQVIFDALKHNKENKDKVKVSKLLNAEYSAEKMNRILNILKKNLHIDDELLEKIDEKQLKKLSQLNTQEEIEEFIKNNYKKIEYELISISVDNPVDMNYIINCKDKNDNYYQLYFDKDNKFKQKQVFEESIKNVVLDPKLKMVFAFMNSDIDRMYEFEKKIYTPCFLIDFDERKTFFIEPRLNRYKETQLYKKIKRIKEFIEPEKINKNETLEEIIKRFERERQHLIYLENNKNDILMDNWIDIKNGHVDLTFWSKIDKKITGKDEPWMNRQLIQNIEKEVKVYAR